MKMMQFFKNTAKSLSVLAMILVISTPSYAVEIFDVRIESVVPRAQEDGDVFVVVSPDAIEDAFTGNARVIIDGTAPGASKLMNVLLAGLLLNKRVRIFVDETPSFNNIQVLQSASLTADD